jgi:hypothetical protein
MGGGVDADDIGREKIFALEIPPTPSAGIVCSQAPGGHHMDIGLDDDL